MNRCDPSTAPCPFGIKGIMSPSARSWIGRMYAGVNFSIPGTGGKSCLEFVGTQQMYAETVVAVTLSLSFIIYTSRKVSLSDRDKGKRDFSSPASSSASSPSTLQKLSEFGTGHGPTSRSDNCVHAIILCLLCASFGVEVYCKLRDSAVVWLLNICHLVTMTEIILFASPHRPWVTALFRVLMHSLHGPFFALLFPVTNTRVLWFELTNYYVQHVLILTGPLYLLTKGGPYKVEPSWDFHWPLLTCGITFFIYWVPVQCLCWITHVNINNMMCPALSDPFYGPKYRQWAMVHSALFILIFGKIYCWVASRVLSVCGICIPDEKRLNLQLNQRQEMKND